MIKIAENITTLPQGAIANQQVIIPKGMIIDPKKGEKIRLEIKVKGAPLKEGNQFGLRYGRLRG